MQEETFSNGKKGRLQELLLTCWVIRVGAHFGRILYPQKGGRNGPTGFSFVTCINKCVDMPGVLLQGSSLWSVTSADAQKTFVIPPSIFLYGQKSCVQVPQTARGRTSTRPRRQGTGTLPQSRAPRRAWGSPGTIQNHSPHQAKEPAAEGEEESWLSRLVVAGSRAEELHLVTQSRPWLRLRQSCLQASSTAEALWCLALHSRLF